MSVQLLASFFPTHDTDGLPNFPAIDLPGDPGEVVLTPEAGTLVYPHFIEWDLVKRIGGWTCYFYGTRSGNTYFLTHFAATAAAGEYGAHANIGTVAAVPQHAWAPHIHEGLHQGYYAVSGAPPVRLPTPTPASSPLRAPGAWQRLTRSLGHDLQGSLYRTRKARARIRRAVR